MEKILVLCAHPDDETLGLGGTLALNSKKGNQILVLFFTDGESARGNLQKISIRKNQAKQACSLLGIKQTKFLEYEDQKLEMIPLMELSKQIEKTIREWKPSIVFTHFWDDVNQDHRRIFDATRISLRPQPKSSVKHIICYETPSSTEISPKSSFNPNLFVKIDNVLNKKLNAFKKYKDEIHPFPHPRSIESLKSRANYWGSSIGLKNAEAFVSYRRLTDNEIL
jgi:LmbE family N-acetylglucosaminyl deacetylase